MTNIYHIPVDHGATARRGGHTTLCGITSAVAQKEFGRHWVRTSSTITVNCDACILLDLARRAEEEK